MKLRNKLAIITTCAMLAFAGAGYAAWTFTAQREAAVSTLDNKVSVGIELTNNFKLYNADGNAEVTTLYLICDAPTTTTAGILETGNGIYWATDAAGANAITSVYLKGTVTKDDNDGIFDNKATITVQFGASDNIDDSASVYLTIGNMTAPANLTGVSTDNGTVVKSVNFNLPAVSYKSVPTSVAQLDALKTEANAIVTGKTLSFTAQIVG